MGLSRKKVTVRGKNGKTFQRSVMVRSDKGAKRSKQVGLGIMTGKTGSGTSFKHGLVAGGLLGAAGAHRMGKLGMAAAVAQRGMSHVATHQALKARGQQGKTIGQKVKHFLSNEAGQMLGAVGGIALHEGGRRLAQAYSNRKHRA